MDNFDDFLRAELRRANESRLDEYGNREALTLHGSKAFSDLASKFSSRAQGASNLKAKVQAIVKEFKIYCGEQNLPYRHVVLNDFAEFAISKLNFGDDADEAFDMLVFGKKSNEADSQDEIDSLMGEISEQWSDDATPPDDDQLDHIWDLAHSNEDDKIALTKALWRLTRKHPTILKHMGSVKEFIGKPMNAQKLYQVATVTAQVILKGGAGEGKDSGKKKKEKEGEEELKVSDLDEGEKVLPTKAELVKKYRSTAFDDIEDAGLTMNEFQMVGQLGAQAFAETDPQKRETLQKQILKRLNRFSPKDCIRLTRLMLVFFVYDAKPENALQPLITLMTDTMQTRWEDTVMRGLKAMSRANRAPERKYDATVVNESLFKVVNKPVETRSMLAIMTYCLYARL